MPVIDGGLSTTTKRKLTDDDDDDDPIEDDDRKKNKKGNRTKENIFILCRHILRQIGFVTSALPAVCGGNVEIRTWYQLSGIFVEHKVAFLQNEREEMATGHVVIFEIQSS
jgi:hypothetical protein